MHLFYQPEVSKGQHFLDEEESRHCVKVLRHSTGDVIEVQDGHGHIFKACITVAHQKKCEFEVLSLEFQEAPSYYIHIAIAPTKNLDRIEWFIEKAVEIGVQEISFVLCKNSERRVLKNDRLERKALSAMKQSGHLYFPKINQLIAYDTFITEVQQTQKFIAHVDFNNPMKLKEEAASNGQYCILIGPEGDFTTDEIALALQENFKKVGLGNSRLRTETAGIVACHTFNMLNE